VHRSFSALILILASCVSPVIASDIFDQDNHFPGKGSKRSWATATGYFQKGLNSTNSILALSLYGKAVSTYPFDPLFFCAMGESLIDRSNADAAEQAFLNALKLDSNCQLANYDLAVLRRKQQSFSEAEQLFRKAVTLVPNDFLAWYGLQMSLYKQGRLTDCMMSIQAELQMDLPNLERQQLQDFLMRIENELSQRTDRTPESTG
jgi:tetratricopeptide (TPR) repeat protein